MHDLSMPLWERYLMTIEEASSYFRIGENKLRQIANEHKRECVVMNGTLRHTFCTRLAQKNMNPKNLQYIMGHSNISITLNLYAHASEVGANKEMRSMIA